MPGGNDFVEGFHSVAAALILIDRDKTCCLGLYNVNKTVEGLGRFIGGWEPCLYILSPRAGQF